MVYIGLDTYSLGYFSVYIVECKFIINLVYTQIDLDVIMLVQRHVDQVR
jgi:hypothetical protein